MNHISTLLRETTQHQCRGSQLSSPLVQEELKELRSLGSEDFVYLHPHVSI